MKFLKKHCELKTNLWDHDRTGNQSLYGTKNWLPRCSHLFCSDFYYNSVRICASTRYVRIILQHLMTVKYNVTFGVWRRQQSNVDGESRNYQQVNVRSTEQYKLVDLTLFVQEKNLHSIIFLTYYFLDTSFLLSSSFQRTIARPLAGEKFFCC